MYGKWCVGIFPDEVWIVRAFGSGLPEGADALSAEAASFRVAEWFADDGLARQVLAEIYEEVAGALLPNPRLPTERMRERVREAFERGALRAYRIPVMLSATIVEAAPEQPKAPELEREEKTWVAIELLDTDSKPVPFKKYRIELPDESVREGLLDANGQAMIRGIDPGTCKVSFPQFDAADWKQA
jgi:hypothetical protein